MNKNINNHDKYVECAICGGRTHFIGKRTGWICNNPECDSHKYNKKR